MSACQGLLVLGFGGHARSVADVALATGVQTLLFVDEHARDGEQFLGFPVQRAFSGGLPDGWLCMPAAGDNRRRQAQVAAARQAGWQLATLIAPTATLGVGAQVAAACLVAQHAHIGPMARVGEGSIINTGAVVEHECLIGDYVHVSVNTTIAGRCRIGDRCFIGAGATVIDGKTVAADVMVGAGGVIVCSTDQPGTYVGVPARLIGG